MTRSEHLQWAKDRAKEYIDKGDVTGAAASFISDMNKHDDLRDHVALPLMGAMMLGGHLTDSVSMWRFIQDFN